MPPNIIALWLDACPSFGPSLSGLCAEHGEQLLYVHAGAFARHLLALHRSQQRDEFPAIGTFIERLHMDDDPSTREFATVGLLESIQNVWSQGDTSPQEFYPFLQPASAAAWRALNRFWSGEKQ
jgi:hypothetical protein